MFYGPWPPNSNTGNPSPFRISVFTSTHWKDWNFLLDSIYDFHLKRLYALTEDFATNFQSNSTTVDIYRAYK